MPIQTVALLLLGLAMEGRWVAANVPPKDQLPSKRWGHAAVYDPVRDRMILFGGRSSSNRRDTWALDLSDPKEWSRLAPAGDRPTAKYRHSMIYDSKRDRVIVFAGDGGNGQDTWELTLEPNLSWRLLAPTHPLPPPRWGHVAVYDAIRDRMIVFGGAAAASAPFRNDVWMLDMETLSWSEISVSGTGPSRRWGHAAVFDSVENRVLVLGGYDGNNDLADLWSLDLASNTWDELEPSLPVPRSGHSMILDSTRRHLVVAGGCNGTALRDAWILRIDTAGGWEQLETLDPEPSARREHAAVFDPLRDRMVLFGGVNSSGRKNDTWCLSLDRPRAWNRLLALAVVAPPDRSQHVAVYDDTADRLVIFGGGIRNDAWALPLGGPNDWSALEPAGEPPSRRSGHSVVYEADRDRMIVFGGQDEIGLKQNDLWTLSLSGQPTWERLIATNPRPAARIGQSAVYDCRRNRMIVFGGLSPFSLVSDTWSLELKESEGIATWVELATTGPAPAPRREHAAVFDPQGDRMIVFGGFDGGSYLDDVWVLSFEEGARWEQLEVDEGPTPRFEHTALFDPNQSRMIVFGGDDGQRRNDVWVLSLVAPPRWNSLSPNGTPPTPRAGHTAVLDSRRGNMVVFAGFDGRYLNDTWILRGLPIDVGELAEVEIRGETAAPDEPSPPPRLPGSAPIQMTPPGPSSGTITIYTVSGRIVRRMTTRSTDDLAPSVDWDGTDARGRLVSSGIYFVRFEASDQTRVRRVTVLR